MLKLPLILSVLLLVSACSDRQDDERLRLSLTSDCIVTRGALMLSAQYIDKAAIETVTGECKAAYSELLKEVSARELREQQTEVYESFERAYRMKYSLHDVFDSLPKNSKTAYEKLATILFGLKKDDIGS